MSASRVCDFTTWADGGVHLEYRLRFRSRTTTRKRVEFSREVLIRAAVRHGDWDARRFRFLFNTLVTENNFTTTLQDQFTTRMHSCCTLPQEELYPKYLCPLRVADAL